MTEHREARELLSFGISAAPSPGSGRPRWRRYHALDLEAPGSSEDAEIEHLTALIRETVQHGRSRTGRAKEPLARTTT